jgi:RNA polymerase sigma-70 factor (ECF subfamily)
VCFRRVSELGDRLGFEIRGVIYSETALGVVATNGWQAVSLNEDDVESEIPLAPLRQREPAAFERLVRRYEPVVLGLCQTMGLAGADLDDAAAEVFANVFRALPNFEGRSALGTWVYRIACRTIPKVRARVRKNRGDELPAEHLDSEQPTPLEQSESAELYQRLWNAVAKLDEREAMAIELYYRRELPIEQVAGVLECPEGTVKTLLFRGRQKLRERLASQEVWQ